VVMCVQVWRSCTNCDVRWCMASTHLAVGSSGGLSSTAPVFQQARTRGGLTACGTSHTDQPRCMHAVLHVLGAQAAGHLCRGPRAPAAAAARRPPPLLLPPAPLCEAGDVRHHLRGARGWVRGLGAHDCGDASRVGIFRGMINVPCIPWCCSACCIALRAAPWACGVVCCTFELLCVVCVCACVHVCQLDGQEIAGRGAKCVWGAHAPSALRLAGVVPWAYVGCAGVWSVALPGLPARHLSSMSLGTCVCVRDCACAIVREGHVHVHVHVSGRRLLERRLGVPGCYSLQGMLVIRQCYSLQGMLVIRQCYSLQGMLLIRQC